MFFRSAVLSFAALAGARELPKDEVRGKQLYDSGIKHMNNIALKMVRMNTTTDQRYLLMWVIGDIQPRTGSRRLRLRAIRRNRRLHALHQRHRHLRKRHLPLQQCRHTPPHSIPRPNANNPTDRPVPLPLTLAARKHPGLRVLLVGLDIRRRARIRSHRPIRRDRIRRNHKGGQAVLPRPPAAVRVS